MMADGNLWTLKNGHKATARTRAVPGVGVELRFEWDGDLRQSQVYRDGAEVNADRDLPKIRIAGTAEYESCSLADVLRDLLVAGVLPRFLRAFTAYDGGPYGACHEVAEELLCDLIIAHAARRMDHSKWDYRRRRRATP